MPCVLIPRSWTTALLWLHRWVPQTWSCPLRPTGVLPFGGGVVVLGGGVVVLGGGVVVLGGGVVVTVPVHVTPLSVNEDGVGLLLVHVPWKPMVVEAPVPRCPFQEAFFAVTAEPLWLYVADQPWVTFWPES